MAGNENKKSDISQNEIYDMLFLKAYELYKQDWCSQRGYKLGEEDENGFNGELYVCMAEFEDNEFKEEEYMKSLLDNDDFETWKSLNGQESPTYNMVLCIVELERGINTKQISKILDFLDDKREFMPIEFHMNNTSAYGFIDSEYYETHNYSPDFIANTVNTILDDMGLESSDGVYSTSDGHKFYMSYFND